MDRKIIEKLTTQELISLAIPNLFIFSLLFIIIYGFYFSCDLCHDNYENIVNDFKSDKEITCKDTFISKQRGWSIDKSKKRFIKNDSFIEIKQCLKGC